MKSALESTFCLTTDAAFTRFHSLSPPHPAWKGNDKQKHEEYRLGPIYPHNKIYPGSLPLLNGQERKRYAIPE
ncbi:MAG: hypothetical protein ACLU4N_10765 [Butyricimonas faecihominis]